MKGQLIRAIEGTIAREVGRHYQIDLALLDERSLQELFRLLRDLEHESQMRAQRAQRMPWRSP